MASTTTPTGSAADSLSAASATILTSTTASYRGYYAGRRHASRPNTVHPMVSPIDPTVPMPAAFRSSNGSGPHLPFRIKIPASSAAAVRASSNGAAVFPTSTSPTISPYLTSSSARNSKKPRSAAAPARIPSPLASIGEMVIASPSGAEKKNGSDSDEEGDTAELTKRVATASDDSGLAGSLEALTSAPPPPLIPLTSYWNEARPPPGSGLRPRSAKSGRRIVASNVLSTTAIVESESGPDPEPLLPAVVAASPAAVSTTSAFPALGSVSSGSTFAASTATADDLMDAITDQRTRANTMLNAVRAHAAPALTTRSLVAATRRGPVNADDDSTDSGSPDTVAATKDAAPEESASARPAWDTLSKTDTTKPNNDDNNGHQHVKATASLEALKDPTGGDSPDAATAAGRAVTWRSRIASHRTISGRSITSSDGDDDAEEDASSLSDVVVDHTSGDGAVIDDGAPAFEEVVVVANSPGPQSRVMVVAAKSAALDTTAVSTGSSSSSAYVYTVTMTTTTTATYTSKSSNSSATTIAAAAPILAAPTPIVMLAPPRTSSLLASILSSPLALLLPTRRSSLPMSASDPPIESQVEVGTPNVGRPGSAPVTATGTHRRLRILPFRRSMSESGSAATAAAGSASGIESLPMIVTAMATDDGSSRTANNNDDDAGAMRADSALQRSTSSVKPNMMQVLTRSLFRRRPSDTESASSSAAVATTMPPSTSTSLKVSPLVTSLASAPAHIVRTSSATKKEAGMWKRLWGRVTA
ncbi:hypothetical protein BC828DRAFT_412916 [Blastocladiella britannica]|nr:hypothetical protein BC828DRAFT_412916 [Blastocladiella britannica]